MQDRTPRRISRAHLIAGAIAAASAGVLVYWTATARPMWVDEEMLALNVRDRGFLQLAGPLWLDQSAPLGWLVLERAAMLLCGTGERAVRALTMLFGVVTLGTAWSIGRRWMTPLGAAVLVALCGTGEWLVFFTLELKHYSADAAGALLVPALAAWVLDTTPRAAIASAERPTLATRAFRWWLAAAAAMWFSNGALFVTPFCALVLLGTILRRHTTEETKSFAIGAAAWLMSLAAIYMLVLRHALANAYLKNYWAFAFPPTSEGVGAVASWISAHFTPFAVKPIGTGTPIVFWIVYATGVLFALFSRSSVAATFATIPVSLVTLAVAGFVPPFERLAIWSVPAFYVGVALCADAGGRLLVRPWRRAAPYLGVLFVIPALLAALDIVKRGVFAIEHRPQSNYGLDDRSSVRWLMDARRPGDVVLSTHYGLAAIWWYAGVTVVDAERSGRMADGAPLYEIHHVADVQECASWRTQLDTIVRDRSRIVLYLGFRMNVEPEGFDQLVLEEFGRRWPLVGYKEYAEVSRLAIFDLTGTPAGPLVIPTGPGAQVRTPIPTPPGCVSVTPARRW
jgi:hypothetical protein